MTRRLFYLALGATVGVILVRRAGDIAAQWTPDALAVRAGGAREQIGVWWSDVQAAAADREAELREGLGIGGDTDQEGAA